MTSEEKKIQVPNVVAPGEAPVKEVKVKMNSYNKYIPTRAAKGSSGWVHSPANLKLLVLAQHELLDVAIQRGMKVRQPADIQYVRAAMIEGETTVHIYPTHSKDKDRIEVKRSDSGTWVNLITLLADEGLLVEAGYREKFVITSVGAEGTFGPAITFDIANPVERKLLGKKKDDDSKAASEPRPVADVAAGTDEEN